MIYFIGAGPGDVDLITVKGRHLLSKADVIIYTGSLVGGEHLAFCPPKCQMFNSAGMTLEEIIEVMKEYESPQAVIVRLHTGDPTIYGAIREQMKALSDSEIDFEVIPGVSSFTAGCAALKCEFTVPGISQTIIITRIAGKTPVPELEDLELLAAHQCSMAIFLSIQNFVQVVDRLKKGYKRNDVPVAVVYKATWPDQKILRGTLENIVPMVEKAGINRFAQILVGDFIEAHSERSLLYHPEFTHGFRKGSL